MDADPDDERPLRGDLAGHQPHLPSARVVSTSATIRPPVLVTSMSWRGFAVPVTPSDSDHPTPSMPPGSGSSSTTMSSMVRRPSIEIRSAAPPPTVIRSMLQPVRQKPALVVTVDAPCSIGPT